MGMGGSDGCRNDILLIVWEYDILAVLLVGLWAHRLLNRGTLGLQNWSQVYGNYYKKLYQFSIYFR